MWAVEAKTFGDNPNYFYMSGLTQEQSRELHSQLDLSKEWAMIRSWNKQQED